jgi:hypothetical protein
MALDALIGGPGDVALSKRSRELLELSKELREKSMALREQFRTLTHMSKVLCDEGKKRIMKVCSGGKKYMPSEWRALPLVGWQGAGVAGGEVRNCTCGSSMCVITWRKAA